MAMHGADEDVRLTQLRQAWDRHKNPAQPTPGVLPPLSPRALEVLTGIALGESCEDTAARLFITSHTVKTHRARLYRRLGIQTAGQAGVLAAKAGLV